MNTEQKTMSDLIARIECELECKSWNEDTTNAFADCIAEIKRLTEQLKTQKEYYENVIEDGVKQIKEQKMKRLEVQGMADCMDMVMQELQGAGVISKDIPPMMLPEAILAKLSAVGEPVANQCNPHPKATHGFARQASHSSDEYVCECSGFDPYDAGFQNGMLEGLRAWQDDTATPSVDALITEIDILGIVEKDGSDWLNFYKVQAILDKYRSAK